MDRSGTSSSASGAINITARHPALQSLSVSSLAHRKVSTHVFSKIRRQTTRQTHCSARARRTSRRPVTADVALGHLVRRREAQVQSRDQTRVDQTVEEQTSHYSWKSKNKKAVPFVVTRKKHEYRWRHLPSQRVRVNCIRDT